MDWTGPIKKMATDIHCINFTFYIHHTVNITLCLTHNEDDNDHKGHISLLH